MLCKTDKNIDTKNVSKNQTKQVNEIRNFLVNLDIFSVNKIQQKLLENNSNNFHNCTRENFDHVDEYRKSSVYGHKIMRLDVKRIEGKLEN